MSRCLGCDGSCGGSGTDCGGIRQPSRRLLAVLGHELRNPLGAALTGVELVQALCEPGDPRRPVLLRAEQDLQRVTDLLEALLAFGTGGHLTGRRFDLLARLREVTGRRGCRVVLDDQPAGGGCWVRGVPALVDRVVENLVDNALAAGAEKVIVAVRRGTERVEVRVRDDGPGIPAELQEQLFTAGVSGRGSTGIGLALAQELARFHGGDLELAPAGGEGTEFVLWLPLAAEVATPSARPGHQAIAP